MKFYDLWKEHKVFILFALIVSLFFFVFLVNNHIEMLQTKKDYETQIEELKELVQISNIGKVPEKEFDIYQTAEDFLNLYYGISADISKEYRSEQLKTLMTDTAYDKYGVSVYDNTLNYKITLSEIHIYVDYKNSSKNGVYACIFFEENTDWQDINTITVTKYWTGTFVFDNASDKWLLDEITVCQELLTREEFDALIIDTDESIFENPDVEGDDENADTQNEE